MELISSEPSVWIDHHREGRSSSLHWMTRRRSLTSIPVAVVLLLLARRIPALKALTSSTCFVLRCFYEGARRSFSVSRSFKKASNRAGKLASSGEQANLTTCPELHAAVIGDCHLSYRHPRVAAVSNTRRTRTPDPRGHTVSACVSVQQKCDTSVNSVTDSRRLHRAASSFFSSVLFPASNVGPGQNICPARMYLSSS